MECKMSHWLPISLVCMLCWALWAFFAKLAGKYVSDGTIAVCASCGAACVIPIYAWMFRQTFQFDPRSPGTWLAVLAGMLGSLGGVLFYLAVSRGSATKIVTLTSLYPVITTILVAVCLRERVTGREGVGMLLAILGACLLAK
jgi:bacterial/archaeal transporter family protein